MIVDTLDKPFFEYRDFVAGRQRMPLVAEKEEANYFFHDNSGIDTHRQC